MVSQISKTNVAMAHFDSLVINDTSYVVHVDVFCKLLSMYQT